MKQVISARPTSLPGIYTKMCFRKLLEPIPISSTTVVPHTVDTANRQQIKHLETFINVCHVTHFIMLHAKIVVGNVWHGSQEPWHNWDILAGRFVSEFGM